MSKHTTYFLIGCLIASLIFFGYVFFGVKEKPPKIETIEYNHFLFENIGGLWKTTINIRGQEYETMLRYNPKQVEDVPIKGNLSLNFNRGPVYITFDPTARYSSFPYLTLAASELALNTIRGLNKTTEAGCTINETEACYNRTIVSCENKDKSVIYITAEEPTQINLDNRCITLSGRDMNLMKSVDRLIYQWYRIMR